MAPATLAALSRRCPQGLRRIGFGAKALDSTVRLYIHDCSRRGIPRLYPSQSPSPYKVHRVRPSPVLHDCTFSGNPRSAISTVPPDAPRQPSQRLSRRVPPGSIDVPVALSACASARSPDLTGLPKGEGGVSGFAPEVGGGFNSFWVYAEGRSAFRRGERVHPRPRW